LYYLSMQKLYKNLYNPMNEVFYIKICLQQVESKLQWKPSVEWTDSDYRKLSNVINETSGILISHQTLKRLFGKVDYKDQYNPQQATKVALAKFLGFTDWNDFIDKNRLDADSEQEPSSHIPLGSTWKILSIILFLLVLIIIILFARRENHFSISAKNPVDFIPHTVEFDYDISGIKNDSVFLDFGYTHPTLGYQKILLDKNKKLIRHCFQIPYLYKVRLVVNNKILTELPVQACSQGWTTLFRGSNISKEENGYQKNESIIQYGLDDFVIDTITDGFLYFSPQTLINNGMESRKVYYLENRNIRKFNATADNCTFEIRFRNNPEDGGISCFDSRFLVIGLKGSADVMLAQKGCSRWSGLRVSEMVKDGQYDDMSALSRDLGQWTVLKMQVRNKEAKIIIGSDTLYECSYHQPMDSVKGLVLFFKGSAKVDYVKLFDHRDSLIFNDEFNN
jgi:hypothetical protein